MAEYIVEVHYILSASRKPRSFWVMADCGAKAIRTVAKWMEAEWKAETNEADRNEVASINIKSKKEE